MNSYQTQVAVIGASLGGVMAAWQSCRQGVKTILVSEYHWLGGQMTSQGVPPDEHRFIESFGASKSYYAFRKAIREHYQAQPDFVDNSSLTEGLNPGDGWVSRLCFEPKVAEDYFRDLLQPFVEQGLLVLLERHRLSSVQCQQDRITAVEVQCPQGKAVSLMADVYLDATDTGELLKQANMPYALGKESRDEFNEPQTPETADPMDQQPVTWVMALRKYPGKAPAIAKPPAYDFWRDYHLPGYDYPIFSEKLPGGEPFGHITLPLFGQGETLDLWRYRRVIAAKNWRSDKQDVSLINWAQNDYALEPYLDNPDFSEEELAERARQLSLCLLYWLQNEAPRHSVCEAGFGFPELGLAPDVTGTEDGLAQQLYIRESRRIKGLETLTLCDIQADGNSDSNPLRATNSVGIGLYNMDIHPTCRSQMGANARVRPFELPLGIFIPKTITNLLPACKNLSVTHLVGAVTRVHPVEWLVGEVAGLIAAYSISQGKTPADIHSDPRQVTQLQQLLEVQGIPLHWPDNNAFSRYEE
ncbi:hypothetical protein HMF8227_01514 [Saliniradius amylolyticus]|uniref:FAD-dependent oxidoreductase n=1 Tax=Saliniradius amylolyticus TaxID=2183582 RepID=A0A2S2E317_9ALTE|nr:FAD-dependent oxidoreductase [Saliniradius amylolyticus]AWL11989.1 hypothetical protein HMF8227_01514 [Saliniradius amylolyticus]